MGDREIGALVITVAGIFGFKYLYNGALGVSSEGGLFAILPNLIGIITVGVVVAVIAGLLSSLIDEL